MGRNSLPSHNTFRGADCGPKGPAGSGAQSISTDNPAKRLSVDYQMFKPACQPVFVAFMMFLTPVQSPAKAKAGLTADRAAASS